MTLDLQLLPLRSGERPRDWEFARVVLPLIANTPLFDQIRALESIPIPAEFWTYLKRNDDPQESMGPTTEDAYGTPLRMVTAGDLILKTAPYDWTTRDDETTAARQYIEVLDQRTYVVLYWD